MYGEPVVKVVVKSKSLRLWGDYIKYIGYMTLIVA